MFVQTKLCIPKSENANLSGSITVQLTSCLFCLDLAAFGQIQTSQTGGQPYSDTFPVVSVI